MAHTDPPLPEDLAPEVRARLAALMVESQGPPSSVLVDRYLIRHWCEALEDGNPLYLDLEFARSRDLGDVVAPPPAVMTTFVLPFRWPWPPPEGLPLRHIHYQVKEALGLPVGVITAVEMEFFDFARVGDRLSVSQRLVSVSPLKTTRVGRGRFWTVERSYRAQDGRLIAVERLTAFGYGEGETVAPAGQGGWSEAVEEALLGGQEGSYGPPPLASLTWAQVAEGDEVPPLTLPITHLRLVYAASATRDFSPQHSDPRYAREKALARDIFANTPFQLGLVSRYLTDWAGPDCRVRRLRLSMRRNICAGDLLTLTGRVVRKYREGEEALLDLEVELATQEGVASVCQCTVALPVGS